MTTWVASLARRLATAGRVTVMTGAGVSAASGVPTFRGKDGLWRQFRPEDLATPEAFRRDPRLVWEWYDWRRQLIARCQPNRTHEVLAAWARQRPDWTVVTQNVDGLHERAGLEGIVRLHGSIWLLECWSNCGARPWRDDTVPLPELPPRCPHCGGLARPGVVWFGEPLDPRDVAAAERAARCDVFIAAGTSALVYPAAGYLDAAAAQSAFTVEINPDATPASGRVDLQIPEPAEVAFDRLGRELAELLWR
jgi:NAD-dependent deacetylase